jgi:hypothetical protein
VKVKLDVETVPTVPDDPPAAGPDRALDPPPPVLGPPEGAPDGLLEAATDGLPLEAAADVLLPELASTL